MALSSGSTSARDGGPWPPPGRNPRPGETPPRRSLWESRPIRYGWLAAASLLLSSTWRWEFRTACDCLAFLGIHESGVHQIDGSISGSYPQPTRAAWTLAATNWWSGSFDGSLPRPVAPGDCTVHHALWSRPHGDPAPADTVILGLGRSLTVRVLTARRPWRTDWRPSTAAISLRSKTRPSGCWPAPGPSLVRRDFKTIGEASNEPHAGLGSHTRDGACANSQRQGGALETLHNGRHGAVGLRHPPWRRGRHRSSPICCRWSRPAGCCWPRPGSPERTETRPRRSPPSPLWDDWRTGWSGEHPDHGSRGRGLRTDDVDRAGRWPKP